MTNTVGILNGCAINWTAGDAQPYIEENGVRRYISGIPLTFAEAYSGIPEITDPGQVGAMAHWGAVFKLFGDGTWEANSVRGNWSLW